MSKFVIIANRSGASVFGAASAPVKSKGEIEFFDTMEEAQAQAKEYNAGLKSQNVHYYAQEW